MFLHKITWSCVDVPESLAIQSWRGLCTRSVQSVSVSVQSVAPVLGAAIGHTWGVLRHVRTHGAHGLCPSRAGCTYEHFRLVPN